MKIGSKKKSAFRAVVGTGPAPAQHEDDGTELGIIQQSAGRRLRISLNEWKGSRSLRIQPQFASGDSWMFGKGGVSIHSVSAIRDVIEILESNAKEIAKFLPEAGK